MIAGVGLGWWGARSDTQAEISGISRANAQLRVENGALREQEGVLKTQVGMLRAQSAALGKVLKVVAETDHDVRLIIDRQGRVVGAQVITNSSGRPIRNSSGRPITTGGP